MQLLLITIIFKKIWICTYKNSQIEHESDYKLGKNKCIYNQEATPTRSINGFIKIIVFIYKTNSVIKSDHKIKTKPQRAILYIR